MEFNYINNFQVRLRFRLNFKNNELNQKWKGLKNICESGREKNLLLTQQWLKQCKIETNRNLALLNRCEGGIGGNNNLLNKQIRFRAIYGNNHKICLSSIGEYDDDIVFDQVYNTETEKWTQEELADLIYSFRYLANDYMESSGCVDGYIEMKNIDE